MFLGTKIHTKEFFIVSDVYVVNKFYKFFQTILSEGKMLHSFIHVEHSLVLQHENLKSDNQNSIHTDFWFLCVFFASQY